MADLITRIDGKAGRITLNRPKALNALSYEMVLGIEKILNNWRGDEAVELVIIDAVGEKAFCAGGDVRQVSSSGQEDPVAARRFFQIEYNLDTAIAEFSKPYICLIDGIVMGGGLGISVNGRYRVMGDNIMAAMPETGIGLLPDVGATRFLNDCPGRIGLYLGLTGARLDTADAIYVRFGSEVHHGCWSVLGKDPPDRLVIGQACGVPPTLKGVITSQECPQTFGRLCNGQARGRVAR